MRSCVPKLDSISCNLTHITTMFCLAEFLLSGVLVSLLY